MSSGRNGVHKPYLFDHFNDIKELILHSRSGLFTDIDGTISEIAESPDAAFVSASCRDNLEFLARNLVIVAAITGRPASEARTMVGVEDMVYIGNHGLEKWAKGDITFGKGVEEYVSKIYRIADELKNRIHIEGVFIENKGPTVSIHYRRAHNPESSRKLVMCVAEEIAELNNLKINVGKMVVELKPLIDLNKGTAIWGLIKEYNLESAVYLGDDITDIDVFRILGRNKGDFRGISIAVLSPETAPEVVQHADYVLKGVEDVERFLKQVAEAMAA